MPSCSIIGSGCSALTCGIMLAQKGFEVSLFEQAPTVAPTINGFYRKGIYHESGLHCLGGIGRDEPLYNYFRYLGVDRELEFDFFEQSDIAFSSAESRWNLPIGYQNITQELSLLYPEEQDAIKSFLYLVKRLCVSFQYGNTLSEEDVTLAGRPLQDVLDEFSLSPSLVWKLTALLPLYCGTGTQETSFGFYAGSIGTYFFSSGSIEGGGRKLVTALCKELTGLGGKIFTGKRVSSINIDDQKKCTGIETVDGDVISSDFVIATCHTSVFSGLISEKFLRPTRRKYYGSLENTHSFLGIYGRVSGAVGLPRAAVVFDKEEPITTTSLVIPGMIESLPFMFFTHRAETEEITAINIIAASEFEPWDALIEEESFKRKDGYKAYKEEVAHRIIERLMQVYPEISGITIDSISSPATMRDYCNMPMGAIYGAKASCQIQQPLPVLPVRGLFLSGQSLVGPGILGAMTSATLTVEQVLENPDFAKDIHRGA